MNRIKVRSITARMVSDMLERVINLNSSAANSNVFYVFEFSGCVNSVTFVKYIDAEGELVDVFHEYAYLDEEDDLGHPLSAIEQLIAAEELLRMEVQK